MVRHYRYVTIVLIMAISAMPIFAKSKSKDFILCERRAKKYGFTLEMEQNADEKRTIQSWSFVLDVLDNIPKEFVKACKFRVLRFRESLVAIDGSHYGGFAGGGTMTLPYNSSAKTILHELYHLYDKRGTDDREWADCNMDCFIYKGHRKSTRFNFSEKERQRYEKRIRNGKDDENKKKEKALGRKATVQIGKNDQDEEVQKGFVSKYAQTNQLEDRAETFSYMIVERRDFLCRTNDCPVMQAKMKFIIRETERVLDNKFWSSEMAKPPRSPKTFQDLDSR